MVEPIKVSLTWYEVMIAVAVGAAMRIWKMFKPDGQYRCWKEDMWKNQINSTCSEMCVAKLLDRYWNGSVNRGSVADIGDHIGVRHAEKHTYNLTMRSKDNRSYQYVLVTGDCPDFQVWGWIWGEDGYKEEYEREGEMLPSGKADSYWLVPKSDLRPMSDIDSAWEERHPTSTKWR